MCKPTTRRDEYGIYECSYTFPNRIVMATGDTPDVAYAAWVDKMVLTVTDQGEKISSLMREVHSFDTNCKSSESMLKRMADYWTKQDSKP